MSESHPLRNVRSPAALALAGLLAAFMSASQAGGPSPFHGLPQRMIDRQTSDVRVDAARGVVTIDGRALRVTAGTRISTEDAATGTLRQAPGIGDLPERPGLVVYEENADGSLSALIVLEQD
jgi:hypothetical protein